MRLRHLIPALLLSTVAMPASAQKGPVWIATKANVEIWELPDGASVHGKRSPPSQQEQTTPNPSNACGPLLRVTMASFDLEQGDDRLNLSFGERCDRAVVGARDLATMPRVAPPGPFGDFFELEFTRKGRAFEPVSGTFDIRLVSAIKPYTYEITFDLVFVSTPPKSVLDMVMGERSGEQIEVSGTAILRPVVICRSLVSNYKYQSSLHPYIWWPEGNFCFALLGLPDPPQRIRYKNR